MLQKTTTTRETFKLLERLMQDPALENFNLAGGTAIALHLGHRKSIDLDLFSTEDFNALKLESYLIDKYDFIVDFKEKNTLKGSIENIKIDCITTRANLCKEIQIHEGIRMFSLEDIAAMKLLTIADNGSRLKDFIDVAFLSTRFSFDDMINFAQKKYPNKNSLIIEKALLFHDDIEEDDIELIHSDFKWKVIDKRLNNMVKNRYQIFKEYPR